MPGMLYSVITYVKYGYTLKEISDFLGIHYTTVSKVIQKMG